jgi:hypothetical protein
MQCQFNICNWSEKIEYVFDILTLGTKDKKQSYTTYILN